MRTIELIWPDGSIVTGTSYVEVEDALRASQWSTYETRREFRREMRRRAALWSGAPVSKPVVRQTSKAFIRSLAESGMYMLHEAQIPTLSR